MSDITEMLAAEALESRLRDAIARTGVIRPELAGQAARLLASDYELSDGRGLRRPDGRPVEEALKQDLSSESFAHFRPPTTGPAAPPFDPSKPPPDLATDLAARIQASRQQYGPAYHPGLGLRPRR